jgi:hypothetical protein
LSLAGLNKGHPDLHDELNYTPLRQAAGMLTILTQRSVVATRFNIFIPNPIIVTGIGDPTAMVNHLQPESCRESF